jgi:hypothetical protein
MKTSVTIVGSTVALTLGFYLLAYYFLPPPPPSSAVMVLFAAIATVLVWFARVVIGKVRARKSKSQRTGTLLVLILAAWQLGFVGGPVDAVASHPEGALRDTGTICHLSSGPKAGRDYEHAPAPLGSPCDDGAGSEGFIIRPPNPAPAPAPSPAPPAPSQAPAGNLPAASAPPEPEAPAEPPHHYGAEPPSSSYPEPSPRPPATRVTGIALLPQKATELPGYGLYSYALLARAPEEGELPRYRAFLRALLELPLASQLARYAPKDMTNITYIPVTTVPPQDWGDLEIGHRVDFVISHYDYARAAVILAALPQKTGTGPVITSVLVPVSVGKKPHPVLVQDLSTAQPVLMADYVSKFVGQVAQDRFWEPDRLADFALSLRNLLETAAIGTGLSMDAVKSWISYFK